MAYLHSLRNKLQSRNWLGADLLVLLLLAVLIVGCNALWIAIEQRPPHWDMARHLYNSAGALNSLNQRDITDLFLGYGYYPPLVYWQTLPWYLVLGSSVQTAVAANFPFILLLLASVYGLGRQLGGRTVGLLAAGVTLTTPMLVSQFKEFQLDAPTTSLAMAALYVLVRSEGFRHTGWSILVGITIGLGLLCKWTFGFIVGLPLAYGLALAVIAAYRQRKLRRLSGVMVAGLWAYAIPSAWYITNLHQIKTDLFSNGVGAGVREGDPVVGSWASNIWYLENLVNHQLYLILALGLLAGMVVAWRHRASWKPSLYPVLATVGILVFFTLLRNKDARYTLPLVPLVVLLGCAGAAYMNRKWRRVFVGSLAVYSLVTFMAISFGLPWRQNDVTIAHKYIAWGTHGYIIGPPTSEQWHQEEAFMAMAERPGAVAANGPDTIWFNNWGVLYYGRKYNLPVVSDQASARYLLYRSINEHPSVDATWQMRKHYTLPDGGHLFIYERR